MTDKSTTKVKAILLASKIADKMELNERTKQQVLDDIAKLFDK